MRTGHRGALAAAACASLALGALTWRTLADLEPLPGSLQTIEADAGTHRVQLLDRRGNPLTTTYAQSWNVHDTVALHDVPELLRTAFVIAEDRRFFEHAGVDWGARAAALVQNVRSARAVRGASTITEQVVRMLHPRPRTLWSRWLEGWEARRLERTAGKSAILEFYLNQVPYAANRRGIAQAAHHYFARDLATLSRKETLALAVLVRAPTRFDLRRAASASEGAIERLAAALVARGKLAAAERDAALAAPFALASPELPVFAPHFVRHARARLPVTPNRHRPRVATTLDASLQARVQGLLDRRLRELGSRRVRNGAVLAVDHTTHEVLAWVVGGGGSAHGPATHIDPVTTPRQPGSALKPFLYALALEHGWTAAHVIEDAPLTESTAGGMHSYQNYSRRFYGPVTLRDALGNSLNIPALKTAQHVRTDRYLAALQAAGFAQLTQHPNFYGDGIALGSGAVTLLELVQAYTALANRGVLVPLTAFLHDEAPRPARRLFSPEAASLVADILSDADARALEFGRDGVLTLPVQTAVKTGTSSDFRDAWAVGFDYRHTVGVWMGNLDQIPTDGITGATGPALVLRAVLAELARGATTQPLYLSPRLLRRQICVPAPQTPAIDDCLERAEWFLPGTAPASAAPGVASPAVVRLRQPTPGLRLAYDPRLPPQAQVFAFIVDGTTSGDRVRWSIDGRAAPTDGPRYRWQVVRGGHRVAASVWRAGELIAALPEVAFTVE